MIDVTREDGLWVITLNRPDKANSLTEDMLARVAEIATDAAAADLRAFVITGAGNKVFSAGADLQAAKAGLAVSPVWEQASGAIAALPCLTIATLNGTLAGGAFGMALACDIRVAVPGATFFYPVAKLGFLPQPSDPGRLRDLVGPSRAKLLLMGAQKWTAEEAYAFGLVDRLVGVGTALDTARDIAGAALDGKPEVLTRIKQMCG
ncbi:MAG: enoyl-CoA hydratase/isomerase family protein [Pseudomonadota bacterium]